MDWEAKSLANEMIIDEPGIKLSVEKEITLMHHIFNYFQDSEIKGTMANLNYSETHGCKFISSPLRDQHCRFVKIQKDIRSDKGLSSVGKYH
jgi:hypothetical protein